MRPAWLPGCKCYRHCATTCKGMQPHTCCKGLVKGLTCSCAMQTMLEEAVAIVMAPRDSRKRCGLFRLSAPGGLQLVQKCPERGFHTHAATKTGQPLYELCGHVYLNPRVQHDVVDLR